MRITARPVPPFNSGLKADIAVYYWQLDGDPNIRFRVDSGGWISWAWTAEPFQEWFGKDYLTVRSTNS